MKTRILKPLAIVGLSVLALNARAQFPFVVESPEEFSVLADYDGDNIPELTVVDKATGQFRVGYESGLVHNWSASLPSGVTDITGFSVGRTVSGRYRPFFTSPADNRIFTTETNDLTLPGEPMFPSGLGPAQVVGTDVGGSGNDLLVDDLFVATKFNSGFPGTEVESLRINATNFTSSPIAQAPVSGALTAAKRVRIINSPPTDAVAALQPTANQLHLFKTALGGVPNNFASVTHSIGGTNYCAGFFGGSNTVAFVLWRPGLFSFQVCRVQELSAGVYNLVTGLVHNVGMDIRQLAVIETTPSQLLALVNNGSQGLVYNFNGVNPPVLVQTLTPPAGEKFTIGVTGTGGRLFMNSGTNGISAHTTRWLLSGTNWVAQTTEAIPPTTRGGNSINALLFDSEPFVAPQARLLARYSAPDWTINGGITNGIGYTLSQSFGTSAQGLHGGAVRPIARVPAGVGGVLINQHATHTSLHFAGAARGKDSVNVAVNPLSGKFSQSVQPIFTATPATAGIHWRIAPSGSWQTFVATSPPTFFTDSTLQFYAEDAGVKSAVNTVAYTFDIPAGKLDSDSDGVPDFVELNYGLDPLHSGRDSDGDGFSDLEEILAGTSPTSAASHPDNHLFLDPTYDLVVTPTSYSPVSSNAQPASIGTAVELHDPAGALRNLTNVSSVGSIFAAPLRRITRLPDDRLLALSTVNAYDLSNAPAGNAHGRELLALHAPPALPAFRVDFDYNSVIGQASNVSLWLSAARAETNAAPPSFTQAIDFRDTLAALLMEYKLELILKSRGWNNTNRLTLFPFRPADAAMQSVSLSDLAVLERADTNGAPAWSLANMAAYALTNSSYLTLSGGNKFYLAAVAYTIYIASVNETNLSPAPVDALREYIRHQTLPTNYAALASLAGVPSLPQPSNAVAEILAGFPQRTLVSKTLTVTSHSFDFPECGMTFYALPGGTHYKLVLADGAPFMFPQSFDLPAGTTINVTGYTDAGIDPCADVARFEVITATLSTLPIPSSSDANGNLLVDDWESTFLVGAANADADGDGFSNLQEMLDGTDPNNAALHGSTAVNLAPPQLTFSGSGATTLEWNFPQAYAGKFNFSVISGESLITSFTDLSASILNPSTGVFRVLLPASSSGTRYYRLVMSLR